MAKRTPTNKFSRNLLKDRGYEVDNVQQWLPWCKRFRDLFNFIDIVAIKPGSILAVQTTMASGDANRRIAKILAEPRAKIWLTFGGIEVHGWKKTGKRHLTPGRWICEITPILLTPPKRKT